MIVKIIVPFWPPCILGAVLYSGSKTKRDHNSDNHPYDLSFTGVEANLSLSCRFLPCVRGLYVRICVNIELTSQEHAGAGTN